MRHPSKARRFGLAHDLVSCFLLPARTDLFLSLSFPIQNRPLLTLVRSPEADDQGLVLTAPPWSTCPLVLSLG